MELVVMETLSRKALVPILTITAIPVAIISRTGSSQDFVITSRMTTRMMMPMMSIRGLGVAPSSEVPITVSFEKSLASSFARALRSVPGTTPSSSRV